jgi:hypothetical protein
MALFRELAWITLKDTVGAALASDVDPDTIKRRIDAAWVEYYATNGEEEAL